MQDTNQQIIDALNWRYAVKQFDPSRKVSDKDFETIMESARLSPSSSGTEPWKFIIVTNPKTREKLKQASFGQPKVTDADKFVVLARRTDLRENIADEATQRASAAQNKPIDELQGLKDMINGVLSMPEELLPTFATAQTFIALGIMIETAALLGVDAGPMGGFSNSQYDEILGLSGKNLASTVAIAFGYRDPSDPYASAPKFRRSADDVILYV